MTEQQEFAKRIEEMVDLAKDQENVIFEDQLFEIFPEIKDDKAKYEVIAEFLKEKKIGLNEKLPFEEYLTEDEKNYFNLYLEDLNDIPKLSDGEWEAYVMAAMNGDEGAIEKVMNDFLKKVVEIARLYVGQGVLLEDLIGEGNMALVVSVPLLESLENPKEAEGFLTSRVMDAMQDLIARDLDAHESEEKLLKKVERVAKAAKELADTLGRKVTIYELADESKMSLAAIEKALKLTANGIEDIEIPDYLK